MDSRGVSSSFVSSTSENSYGLAKPAKTRDEATASHDSSEETVGQSPDGSVRQRHARPTLPKLGKREESLPLLIRPDQDRKHSTSAEPRQSKRKSSDQQGQGRPSSQPMTIVDTPPLLPPRNSSLPVKDANAQPSNAPVVATSKPTLQQKKHDGPTVTGNTHTKSWNAMHAWLRKTALAKDTSMVAMKHIKHLYTADCYKDVPDKEQIIFGKTTPILYLETSGKANGDYFWRLFDLYKLNETKEVVERMERIVKTVVSHEHEGHKFVAGVQLVELMTWRLTPKQRNLLRRDFPLLYWNTTINDDINWLFFDTIISSVAETHIEQKKIMQTIIDAPVDKRLQVRDKIMDKAHSKMSVEQRNELKRICKARYDEVINSRLTTLHVLIRQQNQEAMMEYVNNVLHHAPPAQRVRLLQARGDTVKGTATGDAAFFRLAHSGNVEMMGAFMKRILMTSCLGIEEKWLVLTSFQPDRTSALRAMMLAGDWPRVERFLAEIYRFQAGRQDCLDTYRYADEGTISIVPHLAPVSYTMVDMLSALLLADVPDHTRSANRRNVYTDAIEHGKKECARKFKKVIQHKDNFRYFFWQHKTRITKHQIADHSQPTIAQGAADRARCIEEGVLFKVREALKTEALPPKHRDEELEMEAYAQTVREEKLKKRLEEYPDSAKDDGLEAHLTHKMNTARNNYPIINERTVELNAKRKIPRKLSALFTPNSTQDPVTSSPPTSPKSPRSKNLYKTYQIRRVTQSVPTMPSVSHVGTPIPSPALSSPPEKRGSMKPRKSPTSPYKGEEQPLIDASENEGG